MHTDPMYWAHQGKCPACPMQMTYAAWEAHTRWQERHGRCPGASDMTAVGMEERGGVWRASDAVLSTSATITMAPLREGR